MSEVEQGPETLTLTFTMTELRLVVPMLERLLHSTGLHWDRTSQEPITLAVTDATIFVGVQGRRIAMSRSGGEFYEAGERVTP